MGRTAVFGGLLGLLLFSVQPMFAKLVLPVLGGSSSVWAVALVFFQAALLAGYGYAHLLMRWLPVRETGYVHLLVCAVALLVLPIRLPGLFAEPPPGDPTFWQLCLFAVGVGLPYFAVAGTCPLLLAWFARSGHAHAKDPYFLYTASNLGGVLALLGYPLLLEPALGLKALSRTWAVGFVLLILLIALCHRVLRRADTAADDVPAASAAGHAAEAPTWRARLGWIGLAMVPAALLTAFTTHVSTDIASAPLIWVIPLALYLLTFVLVFRDPPLIPTRILLAVHLAAVVVALLALAQTKHESWFISAATGVTVFFTSALVAHRTLYEARPAARHLTEFYLWMSFGGMLGGLFAALVAPRIFSQVYEYPLLLALTMACRPGALTLKRDRDEWLTLWIILATGILALFWGEWLFDKIVTRLVAWDIVPFTVLGYRFSPRAFGATPFVALAFAIMIAAFWRHPPRQMLAALVMFATIVVLPSSIRRGDAERSYFGVYRVAPSEDGNYMILTHGTTLHGAQRIRDEDGNLVSDISPGTYYHPESPMALAIAKVRERLAGQDQKGSYAVIGLGAGSLACYAEAGEQWRFFEIDPLVVRIASNPEKFSYLSECQPKPDIIIGDARLTITRVPDESLDVLIVDAFTSDAIPVHLMTAEALRLYLAKLKPDGIVVLHISNRYLDLDGVVAATAGIVDGARGLIITDDKADGSYGQSTSTVAVLAKSDTALEIFDDADGRAELPERKLRPWTDDYSDIIGPFFSKLK